MSDRADLTNPASLPKEFTRRVLLKTSFAGAALAGATACACASSPPKPGTVAKSEAQYQDSPKGLERCGLCKHFYSPNICEVVAGPVSSQGWCKFYTIL